MQVHLYNVPCLQYPEAAEATFQVSDIQLMMARMGWTSLRGRRYSKRAEQSFCKTLFRTSRIQPATQARDNLHSLRL